METSLRKAKDEVRKAIIEVSKDLGVTKEIDISHDVDYNCFLKKYAEKSKPFIIKGGATEWPLTKKGLPLFDKMYGHMDCNIRRGDYSTGIEGRGYFTEEKIKTREYIKKITEESPHFKDTYAPYQVTPDNISDIIDYPNWLPSESVGQPMHFWLGPKESYIAIHSDTCDKLVYQAVGDKEWCLIPPHYASELDLFEDFGRGFDVSPINPFEPNLDNHPNFREIPLLKFKVSAGVLFFLPGGWYHSVKSVNISLSFEYKSNPIPFSIIDQEARRKYMDNILTIKDQSKHNRVAGGL